MDRIDEIVGALDAWQKEGDGKRVVFFLGGEKHSENEGDFMLAHAGAVIGNRGLMAAMLSDAMDGSKDIADAVVNAASRFLERRLKEWKE